jgi:hypothetical protein
MNTFAALAFGFGNAQCFFPFLFPTGLRPKAIRKYHDENKNLADESNCRKAKAMEMHAAKLLIQRTDVNQPQVRFFLFFRKIWFFSLTVG